MTFEWLNPMTGDVASTERIIVLGAVADAFAEKFRAKAASMAVGDPREGIHRWARCRIFEQ